MARFKRNLKKNIWFSQWRTLNSALLHYLETKESCNCSTYTDNSRICTFCYYKAMLKTINVYTKLDQLKRLGFLVDLSATEDDKNDKGSPYKGDFCDVCGKKHTIYNKVCGMNVCSTCYNPPQPSVEYSGDYDEDYDYEEDTYCEDDDDEDDDDDDDY